MYHYILYGQPWAINMMAIRESEVILPLRCNNNDLSLRFNQQPTYRKYPNRSKMKRCNIYMYIPFHLVKEVKVSFIYVICG
jgi:hypothetical protein